MYTNYLKLLYPKIFLSIVLLIPLSNALSKETGFNPNVDGYVSSLLIQPDGKILVGGDFTEVGNVSRSSVARITTGGEIDLSLNTGGINRGGVRSMALQEDGKIVVGGGFTTIGGDSGLVRRRIARLNSDGSVDASFDPGADDWVTLVLLQPNGKILIGGAFDVVAGVERKDIARLNSDGSFDTTFINPNIVGDVETMILQDDGKIIVGGSFISIADTTRHRVARLNSDGSLDASFKNPKVSNRVSSLRLQSDGKLVIGGTFQSVEQYVRKGIARLNSDGSLDLSFNPVVVSSNPALVNGWVRFIMIQGDGAILVGGEYSRIGGVARNGFARLNADGEVDTTFDPPAVFGSFIRDYTLQDDGKILIGGGFNRVGTTNRHGIARFNADGSLDAVYSDNISANIMLLLEE